MSGRRVRSKVTAAEAPGLAGKPGVAGQGPKAGIGNTTRLQTIEQAVEADTEESGGKHPGAVIVGLSAESRPCGSTEGTESLKGFAEAEVEFREAFAGHARGKRLPIGRLPTPGALGVGITGCQNSLPSQFTDDFAPQVGRQKQPFTHHAGHRTVTPPTDLRIIHKHKISKNDKRKQPGPCTSRQGMVCPRTRPAIGRNRVFRIVMEMA